jgi:hypothetical protein
VNRKRIKATGNKNKERRKTGVREELESEQNNIRRTIDEESDADDWDSVRADD